MPDNNLIKLLHKEIRKTGCDVKAEVHVMMGLHQGLDAEDFKVCCDGLFYREYNKDVVSTGVIEDAGRSALLQLNLTRSGIYDHLPEGLFFQPGPSSGKRIGAAEMATEHKRNKQKEDDIRTFFQPFENDFFRQRLQLEMKETEILEGLQCGILNDFFVQFWNIPASIPASFVVPLIALLPYASKVAGNLSLTGQCLELLLCEKVQVKQEVSPYMLATESCLTGLGEQKLGVDSVCGDRFMEDYPVVEFTIGPLQHSQVHDYLQSGKRFSLLQTFYEFFLPAGAEGVINIELPAGKNMKLDDEEEPVLGYSSVL